MSLKFFLTLVTIFASFLLVLATVGEYLGLDRTVKISEGSLIGLAIITGLSLFGWGIWKMESCL